MICPHKGVECSIADLSVRLELGKNEDRGKWAQTTKLQAINAVGSTCAKMEIDLSDIWPASVEPHECPIVNSAVYEVKDYA
jgi:hypothetical protein